ncbi:MAG: PAS domain S-box protein [Nitrospira sp.]|nr:PAS domain S-box protein [Nitrospira sp.]
MTQPSKREDPTSHHAAAVVMSARPEQLFNALLEQSAVAVALIETATGRIVAANRRCEDITGLPQADLIATPLHAIIHPHDVPTILHQIETLKTGRTPTVSLEHRCFKSDGSIIWVALWLSSPCDIGQSPTVYLAILKDITERKQIEEALRASELRFRALSEATTTAIFVYQHDRFLYANPAALAISRYTLEELLTISLWHIIHPEFRDWARSRLTAIERGDQDPSRLEIPILRKDGETRWLDFSAATILIDGQPARIGSAYDITERRLAEARERARLERVIRLQEGQLKFARLTYEELTPDLRTIIRITAETIGVERVGLWLFNGDRSALVCRELYRRSLGTYETEPALEVSRYPAYFEALQRGLSVEATSASSDDVTKELAEPYLRPLGIASMLDAPIRRAGNLVGVLCCEHVGEQRVWSAEETSFVAAAADHVLLSFTVEERRMATEALRASEARFALAAQGANDGLWDWNMATDEAYLSPRWKHLLGFEDGEVSNRLQSLFGRLHPDDESRAKDALLVHLERRVPYDLEFRLRCKDGSYRWFRSRGQAQWDDDGRPYRMAGSITDITDRRQAFDALSDAYRSLRSMSREVQVAQERERTRLSRELHDEFGQSLGALQFDLTRLAESGSGKTTPSGSVRQLATSALATVERLFVSLREMIEGLRPAVLEELGLVAAIESMAVKLGQQSKLNCRIVADPEMRTSIGSVELEGALYRMIQELLMNIVRHASAKSATVTLRSVEGWVHLTVQDDGRGFQVDKALRKGRHGFQGIRERAELLGGTVKIQSAPGKGSCVTVSIPIDSKKLDSRCMPPPLPAKLGKKSRRDEA